MLKYISVLTQQAEWKRTKMSQTNHIYQRHTKLVVYSKVKKSIIIAQIIQHALSWF